MYDYDLYQAALRSGYSCPEVVRQVNDYVEDAVSGKLTPEDKAYVYSIFGGETLPISDFMSYIADTIAGSIQYGKRQSMCNIFNSIAFATPKDMVPVIQQYAAQNNGKIEDYARSVLQNETYDINKNGRQWMWQVCNEFGWFQVPNDVFPMRSELLGPDYWLQYCKDIFASNIGPPDTKAINDFYGGLDIAGSQIVFANAIEDPWQYAGMRVIHDPATQKDMTAILINCNDCAHCVDLHTPNPAADPPTLSVAREKIQA
jgi:hypothetical protein